MKLAAVTRLFLLLLAVCLSTSTVRAKILDTLIVENLSLYQPSLVRNSSGLREKEEFTSLDVQNAIRALYRLGLFRSIDVYVVDETDSSVSLAIRLEEYPIVESVEFSGNKKIKKKDIEEKLTIKKGMSLSDQLIDKNIRALKKLYAEKGYLLAQITHEQQKGTIAGNASIKFKIHEGQKVRIKSITFKENTVFSQKKLKKKFKTKEDAWYRSGDYDEEKFRRHLDTLVMFYNDQGYLDAAIVKDSVWVDDNKKDILIEITVKEGKKYFAGDFFFTGNSVIETDTLKKYIALKKGKPFSKTKFEQTLFLLGNAYREEGFLWVQLKDQKTFRGESGDTVDVTVGITEGVAAVVRKIDISGNNKTREKVIRRELVLYPGQKYKQSRMMRSVREITQLDYFSDVKPNITNQNEDGTIDLDFNVTEKENIGQLSLGAAYSRADGPVGTFSTSIPNFRGLGQKLNLNIEYGSVRKTASIGFEEPWAFDTPTRVRGDISYEFYNYSYYKFDTAMVRDDDNTTRTYGFAIGAGRRLRWPDDYFNLSGTYELKYKDESGTFYANGVQILDEGILSKLSLTLRRSDTDWPQFPNEGSEFYITPQLAGLGGDYQFVKSTVGVNWYFPLGWKFVLGSRSRFGLLKNLPWADTARISYRDLFSAGDVISTYYYDHAVIRGFSEVFGGHPRNGLAMFALTTEVKYPILHQQLYAHFFVDMGNSWGSVKELDLSDLHIGTGFGLRLMFPMLGLIGVDFAWGLYDAPDNLSYGGRSFKWHSPHIIIGRDF